MKENKGLQKLTDLESKFKTLLEKPKIKLTDLHGFLNDAEREEFGAFLTKKINVLKGEEKDEIIAKIEEIIPKATKNQIWEVNHNQITWAISTLMQEYGRMPTRNEIANKTELSRQTVYKHLKEYSSTPLFQEQVEQFRFMTSKVLAKVFSYAVNGDIRAAKLYFEIVGNTNGLSSSNTVINNTQNNFIQINQTKLSQETIKQLSLDQLNQIEAIINTAKADNGALFTSQQT
jgi:hypothetical protein